MRVRALCSTILFVSVFLCWIPGDLRAQGKEGTKLTTVQELLEISGVVEQVNYLSSAAAFQFSKSAGESDEQFEKFKEIVLDAFRPDQMLSTIESYCSQNLEEAEMVPVLEWWRSSSGQKVVRLEIQHFDPAAMKGLAAYVSRFQ